MHRLFVVIAAITASSALAAPAATARLAAPARVATLIGDGGVWHCDGTGCTGAASPVLREAVAACTAVADRAGRVAAFTVAGYSFTDADLVRCNRHVTS